MGISMQKITNRGIKEGTAKLFAALLLFLALPFCSDEAPRATIPFAPVRFQIDLNGLDHSLNNPLAYKIFTEQDRLSPQEHFGYSGVFVVMDANGKIPHAFDLCCPYEKTRGIKVVPTDDGTAHCPSCGSTFITLYGFGTVEEGPATEPLQRYRVFPVPSLPGVFQVTN